MKIKKEFIDLIYNKQKKYEFRNEDGKDGIYKIKDKNFMLKKFDTADYMELEIRPSKMFLGENYYYFKDFYTITKQEYNWLKDNQDYFKDQNGNLKIYIYSWTEVPDYKELEIVE